MRTLMYSLLALALTAAAPLLAQITDAPREISLPAGKLADALDKLGEQAGIQIMYEPAMAEGVRVSAVSGTLTVRDALSRLLEKTDLRADAVNEKTLILKRGKNTTSMLGPAAQMRMAGLAEDRRGSPADSSAARDSGDQVVVQGEREKSQSFSGANLDIERTIDDHQPYYIFDSRTIEQSGAGSVEQFLKQRLTMNAVGQTNAMMAGSDVNSVLGNSSTINLRGLGTDKTLILVNGRRRPGVTWNIEYQPDLNGIPLSAIDRMEVLPSSASGIYGGSAIGGVVNVILKRDYTGGEVRVNYDDTVDGDSAGRDISASYGLSLEGGRTHVNFSAAWSDKRHLLLQDRAWIYQRNLADIQSRVPNLVYSENIPWLGSTPNIMPSLFNATNLTLKSAYGGGSLNSRNTYIPTGTAPGTDPLVLGAALLANAGKWNLEFPRSTQSPTGLLRSFGAVPENRSVRVNARRQVLPWLEVEAEASLNDNRSTLIYHPVSGDVTIPASLSINPFNEDVRLRIPDATAIPMTTHSQSHSAAVNALARLPGSWTGMLDLSWSKSRLKFKQKAGFDSAARDAAIQAGTWNPFVDTLQYPLEFEDYLYTLTYDGPHSLYAASLRGTGPLPALPWGRPQLTVGLEHRISRMSRRDFDTVYPVGTVNNVATYYYPRDAATSSGYLEATVPLLKAGLPLVHSLDLQLSGRGEHFKVDTGTTNVQIFYNRDPVIIRYNLPSTTDAPVFSEDTYSSRDYTVGLKYQPVRDLTLRASRATAFLPPRPDQLIKDPQQSLFQQSIIDPEFGSTPVYTVGGGNPDLKPQSAKSTNVGIIWTPSWKPLQGLRLNAEYYLIEQFDAYTSPSAQQVVDMQAQYPERITRDTTTGRITLVDISAINLYHRETEGWDLSLDYSVSTRAGRFSLHAAESIILHLKNQFSVTLPENDAVGFPAEGGAAKYKKNATLTWESGPLTVGWSTQYFGSYRQYGAPGGPNAANRAGFGLQPDTTYTLRQGGTTIPSQMYHDLFVGYTFARSAGANRMLDGLSLQFGLRNVFDKVPPMDAYYATNYYISPFGDMRMRSYWLNVRLSF